MMVAQNDTHTRTLEMWRYVHSLDKVPALDGKTDGQTDVVKQYNAVHAVTR